MRVGLRAIRLIVGKPDPRRSTSGIGLEVDPPLPDSRRHRPADRADAPRSLVVLLERAIRPGHVPLDGDDPARLSRGWSPIGALLIARNVDWWSAEWANRAFLEPFIEPVAPIGPHGRLLLGLALGAKEAGERGLATDVVRLALADGRLTASHLADGLTATVAIACDRPNRWAVSLADVATRFDAHADGRRRGDRPDPARSRRAAAAQARPVAPAPRRAAGRHRERAADVARPFLEGLAGAGGQAGRLARSVLARG